MSTIYVPQLIESAEQAGALPVGTVATTSVGDWHDAAVKTSVGVWREASSEWTSGDASMLGYTALVPVEVEAEYIRESGARRREKTLYVTPWKDPR